MLKTIFLFSLISMNIIFISCKSSTKSSDLGAVSGTVYLEGKNDHSGVKVSLYKPVALNPDLVGLNSEYPNIGVQVSQYSEFDHRLNDPIKSTYSDKNGTWKINDVSQGTYNIVAEKDSFSWKYILQCDDEAGIMFDTLQTICYLAGQLENDLIIRNRGIIIDGLTIPEGISLIITDGSYLLFGENANLEVTGQLAIEGTADLPIKINCIAIDKNWSMIAGTYNSDIKLEYCIISNGNNSVYNRSSVINLINNIFRNNLNAVQNLDIADSIVIKNNLFWNNAVALYNFTISKAALSYNLFFHNQIAVNNGSTGNFDINHNIFFMDSCGIVINKGLFFSSSTGIIENCLFKDNDLPIFIGHAATGIVGTENNFINCFQYFIEALFGNAAMDTCYFRDNYWEYGNEGIFQENLIKEKIRDREDAISSDNGQFIDVSNFRYAPVIIN